MLRSIPLRVAECLRFSVITVYCDLNNPSFYGISLGTWIARHAAIAFIQLKTDKELAMKRSILLSAVLGLSITLFGLQSYAGKATPEGEDCPPSVYTDATDAQTQKALEGKTLVPAFPEQGAESSIVQQADGSFHKVSTRDFLVYDTASGQLLSMTASVTCESTCNTSGSGSCSNTGCDAWGGGCSSHSCFGTGCTGGSCKKTSTAELFSDY